MEISTSNSKQLETPVNQQSSNPFTSGGNTTATTNDSQNNGNSRAGRGRAGNERGGASEDENNQDEAMKREISPFRPLPDQTRILPKKMPMGKTGKVPGVNPAIKRPVGANPFAKNTGV